MERVVITGMGTVNPLGLTVEESWRNAVNGVSGVGPITLFDPSALNVHFAAEGKGFEPDTEGFIHVPFNNFEAIEEAVKTWVENME